MRLSSLAFGLAVLAEAALLAAPAAFAQDSTAPAAETGQDSTSFARQAIERSQDRLAELDTVIAQIEKETANLDAEARAKAEAALERLRETRDAYRARAEEAAANAREWTDAQVTEAQEALNRNWTAFDTELRGYLDAIAADLATRRALLEAQLEARQQAWQEAIEELRTEADKLADQQRAAIEARIEALSAQVNEARARTERLRNASREAWETAKESSAEAWRLFLDTYASIRKSIEDAAQ
jgi:DNA repair exonuclease SbcCD ATPase subunit